MTPFIVIDGQDGSGKGTQIRMLKDRFERGRVKAVFTREPGGVKLAEALRPVIKSPEGMNADPLTQSLLFWAARSAWFHELVLPSLQHGVPVISDRGDSSTYAYQVVARDAPELDKEFWRMRELIFGRYRPQAYIFVDVPAVVARERSLASEEHTSAFDQAEVSFYEKVRSGFRIFSEHVPADTFLVDGARSREEVHEEIQGIIADLFGWS